MEHTWLFVSTVCKQAPLPVLKNRMCLSAVPPPVASSCDTYMSISMLKTSNLSLPWTPSQSLYSSCVLSEGKPGLFGSLFVPDAAKIIIAARCKLCSWLRQKKKNQKKFSQQTLKSSLHQFTAAITSINNSESRHHTVRRPLQTAYFFLVGFHLHKR